MYAIYVHNTHQSMSIVCGWAYPRIPRMGKPPAQVPVLHVHHQHHRPWCGARWHPGVAGPTGSRGNGSNGPSWRILRVWSAGNQWRNFWRRTVRLFFLEFQFSSTLDPQSIFAHNNRPVDFKNLTIGSSLSTINYTWWRSETLRWCIHIWLSDFFKWFVW